MKDEKLTCQYCHKPGELMTSPWGVPATLSLCRYHFWILPFWPNIILNLTTLTIYIVIVLIIFFLFFD